MAIASTAAHSLSFSLSLVPARNDRSSRNSRFCKINTASRVPVRSSATPLDDDNKKCQLENPSPSESDFSRRSLALSLAAAAVIAAPSQSAEALSDSRRALREKLVKDSDYVTLPNGLKVYDVKVGSGKMAEIGDRATIHYVAKWKGITFMTSRQGMGVTGGTPYGFDVGSSEYGLVLKGIDLGTQGMRVGGQRLLIVPPELAYGTRGIQEIPPDATLKVDIELLALKRSGATGFRR